MTSTELATTTGRDLAAEKDFAVALAQSSLLPKAYHGQPANVLVAIEWAHALGVAPMVAMQQLFILDGKPTASAQMIAGLVRRAGHNLRVQGDDTRAVCEITRSDDAEFVFKAVWTMERAQKAGLANKAVWKQYPAAMLKARAITEAARDACPEALLGVAYTAEEVEPQRPAQRVVDTTRVMPERQTKLSGAVESVVVEEPMHIVDEDTGEIVEAVVETVVDDTELPF